MYLKLFSSLLFIIPAALSLVEKIYLYGCIILLCMISSFLYHLNNEQKFGRLEKVMTLALMIVNFYFLFISGFILPYAIVVVAISAVFFFVWLRRQKNDYDTTSSFWHLSVVIITLCCFFGYRSFMHHMH